MTHLERRRFRGRIAAVKPRIGLHRSFDQMWHSYRGYVLVLQDGLRIAVGPGTHAKHSFRRGDMIEGEGSSIPDPRTEWADVFNMRALRILRRGPDEESRPADIDGGIAPSLSEYREQGHLRLDPRTYERSCRPCPFGAVMPTEIIIDQWNPDRKKWRFETHCYGPRDCPRYKPGPSRRVPGRKPGMVFVDDDYETWLEARRRDELESPKDSPNQ